MDKGIPNLNLRVSKDTVVCVLHWPSGFEEIKVNGKFRPNNPLLIWPGVASSQVPISSPPPRPTKKTCSSTRSIEEDQLSEFLSSDKVTFISLKENLLKNQTESLVNLSCFIIADTLYVQSQQYLNGVPLLIVNIFKDLNFETYRCGIKCTISTPSKNRVMTAYAWSVFEEIIRYLKNMAIDNKKCVLQDHLSAMAPTVGKRMYSQELIVRAFQYFATSMSLYNQLRIDYQLPSIKTLTRITLKVSALNETCFMRSVFNTVKENQRQCVIMQDERDRV